MAPPKLRFLHYVVKIADRKKSIEFLRDRLKMKVLRHEEFEKGCEATCNGPYAGRWSKTMIGYGPEDDHFVLELTYNYGIEGYEMGNDFRSMTIAYDNADPSTLTEAALENYKFIVPQEMNGQEYPRFQKLSLSCSNVEKTSSFWSNFVGLLPKKTDDNCVLFTGHPGAKPELDLEFVKVDKVDRGKAFGRVAFAVAGEALPGIENSLKEAKQTILTPLTSLDTPGKATVQVVIAADPDGHEICFVGDEGFRLLSAFDPSANDLLNKQIEADKSAEWNAKWKHRQKKE